MRSVGAYVPTVCPTIAYVLPFNNAGRERLEPQLRPWWSLFCWATPEAGWAPRSLWQMSVSAPEDLLLFLTELRVCPQD